MFLRGADERRYGNIWQTVNMGATRRRCLRSPRPDGFSRLRVTCRRDLKIFQKGIPGPEVQEGTDSPEKTGSGWAGMVRHSWRGAWLRPARRRMRLWRKDAGKRPAWSKPIREERKRDGRPGSFPNGACASEIYIFKLTGQVLEYIVGTKEKSVHTASALRSFMKWPR